MISFTSIIKEYYIETYNSIIRDTENLTHKKIAEEMLEYINNNYLSFIAKEYIEEVTLKHNQLKIKYSI